MPDLKQRVKVIKALDEDGVPFVGCTGEVLRAHPHTKGVVEVSVDGQGVFFFYQEELEYTNA